MKTLQTHNEEMEKTFDEFAQKLNNEHEYCTAHGEGLYCHLDSELDNNENIIPDLKNFITNQNKQLYIKIAEGEIERLEGMKEPLQDIIEDKNYCVNLDSSVSVLNWGETRGKLFAINDSIQNWNNILQELNK